MITREFTINVNNDKAASTQKIILYKGDFGLLLNLTLKNFKFNIDDPNPRIGFSVFDNDGNKIGGHDELIFDGNTVILPVNINYFNTFMTGLFHVQLHLRDCNDGRISVPALDIEVRNTIY